MLPITVTLKSSYILNNSSPHISQLSNTKCRPQDNLQPLSEPFFEIVSANKSDKDRSSNNKAFVALSQQKPICSPNHFPAEMV
jgi:ureidoglycolate hydrolase